MTTWLVDTGPFVAYINRTDPMHEPVAVCVDGFAGQLVTTGAVVTEVMYFLSGVPSGPGAFAELLLAGDVRVGRTIKTRQKFRGNFGAGVEIQTQSVGKDGFS